ncbi:MAG: hypothetical protein J6C07_06620 [Lachnospiraceae bacterium]|nr:hypothetical protein [Lachnospiraceae bacterium]
MRFTTTKMAEQYVQNMYNKPAKETTNTKNDKVKDNKNAAAQKEDNAATYEGSVTQPTKATYTKPVAVAQKKEKEDDLQAKLDKTYEALSDEAKDYLASLKEKFGDIDFFVADCATDEEMGRYFAMGTKKYSCVISSSLIESMATDDAAREKYEKIIANAGEQIEEMKAEAKEELGEEAAEQIEFVGFKVDDNGMVEYFAKLRDDNNSYYAKLKEKRAEAKEAEKKAEEKRNEKLAEEKLTGKDRLHKNGDLWFNADSKEGLMAAIREALGIEAPEKTETPDVAVGEKVEATAEVAE